MKKLLIILSLLIITGCSVGVTIMPKEVSLKTEDNLEVKAANNFLKEKYPKTKIAVIGASIGANLAIQYLAKSNISTSIALSPGINYRGLDISKEINKVDKNLLILVGKGDSYSYDSSQQIAKNNKVELK